MNKGNTRVRGIFNKFKKSFKGKGNDEYIGISKGYPHRQKVVLNMGKLKMDELGILL